MASKIIGRSFTSVTRGHGYSRFVRGCNVLGPCRRQLSYVMGSSDIPLSPMTIGKHIEQCADRYGDNTAFVFHSEGIRRTYSEFIKEVDQLAAGFLSLGLQPGDRVGIWSPSCLEWVQTQFATARVGLIQVNINPAYRAPELKYALQKVGVKALVASPTFKTSNYYDLLCTAVPELPDATPNQLNSPSVPDLKAAIFMGEEKRPGTLSFSEVMDAGTSEHYKKIHKLQKKIQCDDAVNIQFTSGTTGNPKGATLSHFNILNNAKFIGLRMNYTQESVICVPVPMYHCFGMVVGSLCATMFGSKLVCPGSSFEAKTCMDAIQAERASAIYGTPTMFIDMLNHPDVKNYDFSSLETGVMAGSICPIEVMKSVVNTLNVTELLVCFGMTETSPVTFQGRRFDSFENRVTTCGVIHDHVEAKVVDSSENIVDFNTIGELYIRGYVNMLGYWNDEENNNKTFTTGGWLKTGDLVKMDEEGFLVVGGRNRDMVIRGGENIYPIEIENVLYKHPKIEDVQVVGVPDKRLGEELCAWVRLHKNRQATEDEIKDFCRDKLSHFKIPRYIIFAETFPMTVTGKVKKYVMEEESLEILGLSK